MTTKNTNQTDSSATGGEYCAWCAGEGVIHTGVDECATEQCTKCDGTGYRVPAPQAATPLPEQDENEVVPGIPHPTTYADLARITPLQLWNRWYPREGSISAREAFIAARSLPFASPVAAPEAPASRYLEKFASERYGKSVASGASPAATTASASGQEIELAKLAAAHYGRPESDTPALVAFERHRAEQSKIPGMPGLSGAIPNFIAGFHAALAQQGAEQATPSAEVDAEGLLPRIQRALDLLADAKLPSDTWRDVSNVLHACRDAARRAGSTTGDVLEAEIAAIIGFAEAAAESHLVTDAKRFMDCAHGTVAGMRAKAAALQSPPVGDAP